MADRLIVVEGEEDQKFFTVLARNLGLSAVEIRCHPSGKGNAIATFGAAVLKQTPASKSRVALVVDADYPAGGTGFNATVRQINERLALASCAPLSNRIGGGFSSAKAGSALRLGAWVMPNNADDGYCEHFAVDSISNLKRAEFNYAAKVCRDALSSSKSGYAFPVRSIHATKAEIGTWLAWQDPPRMSLAKALTDDLLDQSKPNMRALASWLNWLFT